MLEGLRVLEISSFVASPLAGMSLAQLGAEVVRVDPIGGAPDVRRWPVTADGTSIYWAGLNKGKRSIAVDLRSAEGRGLVTRLAAEFGIVITNGRFPSYADLAAARPDLIHVKIDGHADGRTAVDYTVNAEMGFPLTTGPGDHRGPVNNVVPAWDLLCGLYTALAVVSAERRRAETGQGAELRVPLGDVALATAGNLGYIGEAVVNGTDRPRIGNHLYGGFGRDFGTADDRRVMVVVLNRRHFDDLAALTGTTSVFAELERLLGADFGRDEDRYRHRETIASLVEPWFAAHPNQEVSAALAGTSLLWSPYRTFTELAASPSVTANPLFAELDQPGIGRHPVPGSPIAERGREDGLDRGAAPAPVPFADTAAVLADVLGLGEAELKDLRERKVI